MCIGSVVPLPSTSTSLRTRSSAPPFGQIAGLSFLSIGTLLTAVVMEAIPTKDARDAMKILKWAFRLFPHYSLCRGVYDISVNQQLSDCQSFFGSPCPEMKVTSTSLAGAGFSPPVSVGLITLRPLLGLPRRLYQLGLTHSRCWLGL